MCWLLGNGELRMDAKKRTDTERLDWMEYRGTIEIELDLYDMYSLGDQILEGNKYRSLRQAIDHEMDMDDSYKTRRLKADKRTP